MTTLHMYHWSGFQVLKNNLSLLSKQDSLVIYGCSDKLSIQSIQDLLAHTPNAWYLVSQSKDPTLNDQVIDENQWLALIIKHNNTLAWK